MSRITLALLILLSGCALEEFALRNVPEGPSSSWRHGYADGCWSGWHDFGSRKERERDVARYRADDLYRDGWDTGYRDCSEQAQREAVATATPEATVAETPPPAPSPAPPTEAAPPTATAQPAETISTRRLEIENRIRELRTELHSLEAELDALPK